MVVAFGGANAFDPMCRRDKRKPTTRTSFPTFVVVAAVVVVALVVALLLLLMSLTNDASVAVVVVAVALSLLPTS